MIEQLAFGVGAAIGLGCFAAGIYVGFAVGKAQPRNGKRSG